ncbi:MAG: TIM barrel protein, partial [Candidatus Diapherotrites archaeon]|nr:TIM barrel protein [Candidatus Diapherotrites archaeon]
MSYNKLIFGTAGIPISTKAPSTVEGIKRVSELGLGGMELEFVHSVNVSEQKAPEIKKTALDKNVLLTCHGSYYVNLNAVEDEKIEASIQRVLLAARRAESAGAYSLTFHAGFYLKDTPEKTFSSIKIQLEKITSELKSTGNKINIRPETTGKATQ